METPLEGLRRMVEEATRNSLELEKQMMNPTAKSPFVTMFGDSDTQCFMFRGGEFSPAAWDHDLIIDAMKGALRDGKRLEFLSGPLLCIGSVDDNGQFKHSRLLTEIVLPNLDSGNLALCSMTSRRRPRILKNKKSKGFVRHKKEIHYRSSAKELISHVHRRDYRSFRHIELGHDENGHIAATRARFSEVMSDPGFFGYEEISSSNFDSTREGNNENIRRLKGRCIVQKEDGNSPYYRRAKSPQIESLLEKAQEIFHPTKDERT